MVCGDFISGFQEKPQEIEASLAGLTKTVVNT